METLTWAKVFRPLNMAYLQFQLCTLCACPMFDEITEPMSASVVVYLYMCSVYVYLWYTGLF